MTIRREVDGKPYVFALTSSELGQAFQEQQTMYYGDDIRDFLEDESDENQLTEEEIKTLAENMDDFLFESYFEDYWASIAYGCMEMRMRRLRDGVGS